MDADTISAKQPTILVVDDTELNRDLLYRRLKKNGYQVALAVDGQDALGQLRDADFDLVLLDIMMPVMDGYQVLEAVKADPELRHIPIIMITALSEMDSVVRCIELGAEDYLPKPFNPVLLQARINACLERKRAHDTERHYQRRIEEHNRLLEEQVRQQVRALSSAQIATIFAMSKLAESRDSETGQHLERMREYCRVLAVDLGRTSKYAAQINSRFVDDIHGASPLHDIGKVGVPDTVLQKPGKLTDEEWKLMRAHPLIGAQTLRAVNAQHPGNSFIQMGIDIALYHHEKWDGSGYPYGLAEDAIPLAARILALGDVYDALTSRRCYKEPMSHAQAMEIILSDRGRHFDPDVVDAFLRVEQEFIAIRAVYQEEGVSPREASLAG